MFQKESEQESDMVIGFGHCMQKRCKKRETGSGGKVGRWIMGV